MISHEAIDRIADLASERRPPIQTPDGGMAVVIPMGHKIEKVAPLEPALPRIKQTVVLHDEASFLAYVARFKTAATQIFAEPGFLRQDNQASVQAVFDYHGGPDSPDRLAHNATYAPRYSDEWQIWSKPQSFTQVEFAEFIEENRGDVEDPSAASLLDLVRTFKTSRKQQFNSVVYQPNGNIKIGFEDVVDGGTEMPEQIKVGIPIYFRGQRYAIDIFVRYRLNNGAVTFELKPDRVDINENHAFTELVTRIGKAAGIEPYLGRTG